MWRGHMDTHSVTVADHEVRYQPGDTLILPPDQVHQIFAETESEFVAAMPLGGTVKLVDGMVIDLPWRH